MCKIYFDETDRIMVNTDALNAVSNHLAGQASFGNDAKTKTLDLRVSYGQDYDDNANVKNKTIYYDLTNKQWEVIAINKDGWTIKKSNEIPIMFRRYQSHKAQFTPTPSNEYPASIFDDFMDMLNVKKDGADRLLLKCYIISLFIPKISKAILMLHGQEGAAKSACEKLIKILVDPSSTLLLRLKRKEDDLILQLGVLKPIAEEDLKIDTNKTDLWPKAPNVLTRRLKLVENSLKGVGISIIKSQNTQTKLKTLQIVKNTLEGVQISTPSTISAVTSDMSVKNGVVTVVGIVDTEKISTPKNDENHAQNMDGVDRVDIVDIYASSKGFKKTEMGIVDDNEPIKEKNINSIEERQEIYSDCDLHNQEGADRFRAEVERLSKSNTEIFD